MTTATETGKDQLLTVQEVAARLAIAVRTCWKWTASGMLPRPLKLGSAVRWRSSDIDRFIETGGAVDDDAERGGRCA